MFLCMTNIWCSKTKMVKRIFLSGRFDVGTDVEIEWLKRTECKYRCFSYANIDKESKHYNKRVVQSLDVCEKEKIHIMFDSGAASLHNIQAATQSRKRLAVARAQTDTTAVAQTIFDRYVAYCRANQKKWTFFITLDFKKHQPTIFKMQEKFEKVGLRPVPVYHGDDSLDYLNRYADKGYKLICLGTVASVRTQRNRKDFRYYLDRVFERASKLDLDLHGLALTSLAMIMQYPWWSVDSATWTKNASYGAITYPDYDRNVIYSLHVSKRYSATHHSYNAMSRRHQQHVAETVKNLGFDIKELRDDNKEGCKARHDFNGYIFSHLSTLGIKPKVQKTSWENLL